MHLVYSIYIQTVRHRESQQDQVFGGKFEFALEGPESGVEGRKEKRFVASLFGHAVMQCNLLGVLATVSHYKC